MIKRIWPLFAFAAACASVQADAPFPAATATYFTGSDVNAQYEGKVVAIEGRIIRIESGPKDKPIFELSLAPAVSRTVWIGSLVADSQGKLHAGDTIRVLGYLQKVAADDTWTKAVTKDAHHVLGFCFVNLNSKQGLFLPAGIKQCEAWQAGQRPEQLTK